jgi:hypothetical protein
MEEGIWDRMVWNDHEDLFALFIFTQSDRKGRTYYHLGKKMLQFSVKEQSEPSRDFPRMAPLPPHTCTIILFPERASSC